MGKLSVFIEELNSVLKTAKKSKLDKETIDDLVKIEAKANMIKHTLKLQGNLRTNQSRNILKIKLEIDKEKGKLDSLQMKANKINKKAQPLTKKDSQYLKKINIQIKFCKDTLNKLENQLNKMKSKK